MSLTEIFNDSLKYPFSDMTKFCIIGIVMVVSSLGSLEIGEEVKTIAFNTSIMNMLSLSKLRNKPCHECVDF